MPVESTHGGRRERLGRARLYAITLEASPDEILAGARAALRAGVDMIQLRHKSLPRGVLLEVARQLSRMTAASDALLIVNDHLDLALLSGADGVHLGAGDLSVEAARRVGGHDLLIGASAGSPEAAATAVAAGADHIGCGPAFATPIKAAKVAIGPAGVAAVTRSSTVPVFAIGGVNASNVGELVAVGVRRACVMRGIFAAPDPERAARDLRERLR